MTPSRPRLLAGGNLRFRKAQFIAWVQAAAELPMVRM